MISIEVLRRVRVIYCHAHCPDGLASAMILKDAFRMLGTSPRIEFLAHGTPEHENAGYLDGEKYGAVSLFCDIAPTAASVPFLLREHETIVLDHHKGAEEIVRSFGERGVFADEKLEPGVSGAVLAFREIWEPIRASGFAEQAPAGTLLSAEVQDKWGFPSLVKEFALCVGLRDTWQTKDPRFQCGQWISKMLMSKPASYWLDYQMGYDGSRHLPYLSDNEIEAGRALFEAHEEAVRVAVDQCIRFELPPCTSLYAFQEQASGFRLCSDVAESLRGRMVVGEQSVVAGFSYIVDKPGGSPRLLYSLRGLNGLDVAAICKDTGGGGSHGAAGFSVPLDALAG